MKKYILSLFFLISCMIDTYAHTEQQQEKIEISGIVLDQSKEPLVGVNVSVKVSSWIRCYYRYKR